MDYLAPEAADNAFAAVLGFSSLAVFIAGLIVAILGIRGKIPDRPQFLIPTVVLMSASIVGLGVGAIIPIAAKQEALEARNGKVIDAIEEDYGIELTDDEFYALDYPSSKPQGDFELFGSTEKTVQIEGTRFSQRDIYLVWADGGFGLSQSEDGENFEPLKSKS